MYEIWYRTASDKEIAECPGDYIGCEICQNQKRCCELMAQRLQKAVCAKAQTPPACKESSVFLYNADPNCDHNIVACPEGGVKCTKCNGWFAY